MGNSDDAMNSMTRDKTPISNLGTCTACGRKNLVTLRSVNTLKNQLSVLWEVHSFFLSFHPLTAYPQLQKLTIVSVCD